MVCASGAGNHPAARRSADGRSRSRVRSASFDSRRLSFWHFAGVDLPPQSYSQPDVRLHFYERVLAGVQSLPGVRAAGWVSLPPLGGQGSVTGITLPGESRGAETPIANYRPASPDYFSAMGI